MKRVNDAMELVRLRVSLWSWLCLLTEVFTHQCPRSVMPWGVCPLPLHLPFESSAVLRVTLTPRGHSEAAMTLNYIAWGKSTGKSYFTNLVQLFFSFLDMKKINHLTCCLIANTVLFLFLYYCVYIVYCYILYTNQHTHTHSHTHVCFCELWGLSIEFLLLLYWPNDISIPNPTPYGKPVYYYTFI